MPSELQIKVLEAVDELGPMTSHEVAVALLRPWVTNSIKALLNRNLLEHNDYQVKITPLGKEVLEFEQKRR